MAGHRTLSAAEMSDSPQTGANTALESDSHFESNPDHSLTLPSSVRWVGRKEERRGESNGSPGHVKCRALLSFSSPPSRKVLECDLPPEVQTYTLKVSALLSCEETTGISQKVVKQQNHLLEASFHAQLSLLIFSFLAKGLCEQRLTPMAEEGNRAKLPFRLLKRRVKKPKSRVKITGWPQCAVLEILG